jgi:hypothetical protein
MKGMKMTPRAPAQPPRPIRGRRDLASRALALGLLAGVAACTVGPNYVRPSAHLTPSFKEAPSPANGWIVAQPLDAIPKGAWWSAFNDPVLDGLEKRVVINNQTVAAAEAAYRQARALLPHPVGVREREPIRRRFRKKRHGGYNWERHDGAEHRRRLDHHLQRSR